MSLVCKATCYMPVIRGGEEVLDRFEDGDVVEGPEDKVKEYLASGNFTEVPSGTGTPILIVEPDDADGPEE